LRGQRVDRKRLTQPRDFDLAAEAEEKLREAKRVEAALARQAAE
jgi:hypothetical protein